MPGIPYEQLDRVGLPFTVAAVYVAYLVFSHISGAGRSDLVKVWTLANSITTRLANYSGRIFNFGPDALSGPLSAENRLRVRSRKANFWSFGSDTSDKPPGLGNYDNSCYQNSVLQSLSSLTSLRRYLERQIAVASSNGKAPDKLSTLNELLHKLSGSESNGRKLWTPKILKSMSSWDQQDAQEYYSRIVGDLGKDGELINRYDDAFDLSTISRIIETRNGMQDRPPNPSVNTPSGGLVCPLEGLLAQRVACLQCGHADGLSLLPFNCLTVNVGDKRDYDIRDCLDNYVAIETITGVECSSCTLQSAVAKLKKLIGPKLDGEQEQNTAREDAPTPETTLRAQLTGRLQVIEQALIEGDFTDKTLRQTCHIAKNAMVSSTKTKQAVVARAPAALVLHVNRSVFDERTGQQSKNHARVTYPKRLDLSPWVLGSGGLQTEKEPEQWTMKAASSLAAGRVAARAGVCYNSEHMYELRAIAIHQGVHEDGHYVCYRQHASAEIELSDSAAGEASASPSKALPDPWWELSDEHVRRVSDDMAMHQHDAFLLFYERIPC